MALHSMPSPATLHYADKSGLDHVWVGGPMPRFGSKDWRQGLMEERSRRSVTEPEPEPEPRAPGPTGGHGLSAEIWAPTGQPDLTASRLCHTKKEKAENGKFFHRLVGPDTHSCKQVMEPASAFGDNQVKSNERKLWDREVLRGAIYFYLCSIIMQPPPSLSRTGMRIKGISSQKSR